MVRGFQDICQWFENSKMPYWRIYPHKRIDGGNLIMASQQKEGQSHGDALDDLRFRLRSLNRGTFTLVAHPEANKLPTKGYFLTDIEIVTELAAASVPQINGTGITEQDVTKRIEEALEKYKATQELAELKKKLAELEKEKKQLEKSINDPWNKVIGALAPHSERIVANIFPNAPAQVAGFPPADKGPEENNISEQQGTELNEEQREVLSKFVTVLAHHDSEWIATLKQLTEAIETNPSLIAMVKKFI